MNPLIFLDIDGVLNSVSWQKRRPRPSASAYTVDGWRHKIDPETVLRLNRLITAADAQVVVSSSWRILMTLGEMRDLLGGHGFTGEIIGETPEVYQASRWVEIVQYLWGKHLWPGRLTRRFLFLTTTPCRKRRKAASCEQITTQG